MNDAPPQYFAISHTPGLRADDIGRVQLLQHRGTHLAHVLADMEIASVRLGIGALRINVPLEMTGHTFL